MIRKQWLILYPFALSIFGTLAFFAIYAAAGEPLGLSEFFNANYERWLYLREHLFTDFVFSDALLVPVLAGLAYCLFCALVQAPFFHAVAGPRYPLTPRRWPEAPRLFLFYLPLYLVIWLAPLAGPAEGVSAAFVFTAVQVVAILVIFADYVIVYEDVGVITGLRRSLKLLGLRLGAVLVIFVLLTLVLMGIRSLYGLYFEDATRVFVLLPISQMLVESFVLLFGNLVLIFLYEELRRRSPA